MRAEKKVHLFKWALWIANGMLALGVAILIYLFLTNRLG